MILHGRRMKVMWGHDTAIGRAIPAMPAQMQFGLRVEISPRLCTIYTGGTVCNTQIYFLVR